jgi:hypothetical protein
MTPARLVSRRWRCKKALRASTGTVMSVAATAVSNQFP